MPRHANDWAPEFPTPAQLKEFFAQIECGRITKSRLQHFLHVKEGMFLLLSSFKHDKTKDGWKLLEDVPFDLHGQDGKEFALEFVEFLKPGESSVSGDVMRLRAGELNVHTGQRHAEWLLEHQDQIPKELRDNCLVFPGTVWQGSNGLLSIPCLDWYGDRWCLRWGWLEIGWLVLDRLVRLHPSTKA